jgi:organic radical activating enzyme
MPENATVDAPKTIFIELTNFCNMHCTFCPSGLLQRKREHLEDSTLKSFLNELHELNIKAPILCNILGEPFLNKRLYEYLDLFEESGHPVTLITNMTVLKSKAVQREVLKHNNLTLALSLQTVTKESYKMRGYPQLKFKEFFQMAFDVIEEKFRMGSSSQIEIHVGSNYVVTHDPTVQKDSGLNLWKNFANEEEELEWIEKFFRKINRFSEMIKKRYPQQYEKELNFALNKYKDHIGSRVAISQETLPKDFHRLKNDTFWGYMFLPNVLAVFKSLELWTREFNFVRSAIPKDKFVYVEEKTEAQRCWMADNLGILANGDYVFCCLDYEGEMNLGNIRETPIRELLSSKKRRIIRENAMTQAVCRRCKGNVFVFDTEELDQNFQVVDKYGNGWEAYEKDLYGVGGRWTKGKAASFVYLRIPARKLRIKFFSELEDRSPFHLRLFAYDEKERSFREEKSFFFYGKKKSHGEFEAAFDFCLFKLYRIELESPSFIPDEIYHNGDRRKLGIAVFEISLLSFF